MKRNFILLLFFCAVSLSLTAQKDFFSVPSVKTGQNEYLLKWSAKTKTGRILEEFLRRNESYPKFECKVILECDIDDNAGLEGEVNSLMALLALKKEQSIVFSFQQLDATVDGELWVEYVQGNVQGGQPFTLEWNLNRYRMVDGHVVLFRICHRVYDKELEEFNKTVSKSREAWISEAVDFDLSTVKVIK